MTAEPTVKPKVTASLTIHGHPITAPVLNPGNWWGKCWLIEIAESYWPDYVVIEADTESDALDELADDDKWGERIRIPKEDLSDYLSGIDSDGEPEYRCHYLGDAGEPCDLDNVMIHCFVQGVVYRAEHIQPGGVTSTGYDDYMRELGDRIRDEADAIDPGAGTMPDLVLADWWREHGREDYACALQLGLC